MNSLFFTVSIPLLLVLAGFNHAHGLTTFGKSNTNQNTLPPAAHGKPCSIQANCTLIKDTTCIDKHCLCGDNTHPVNAKCPVNVKQGPLHICNTNDDCVENAECVKTKEKNGPGYSAGGSQSEYSICQCIEGFYKIGNTCGAGVTLAIFPTALILLGAAVLSTVFN